ncbi:MAG: hypothetical protein J5I92_15270 [Thiogranum sp.]|nr:hypothetical protein [Thiogranum sp.]
MLEVVHLVESARYHLFGLERLTSGRGRAPPAFEPGVDFAGEILDAHWRTMASWIEFEAFLGATKRCLDRAWCCLGEALGDEASEIRTLGGAVYNLNKKVRDESLKSFISQLSYFKQLVAAWTEWGQELADLRNYVEHQAPLGGRSFGFTQETETGAVIRIFIPDEIPRGKGKVPKKVLTFSKQISANEYGSNTMARLDKLVSDLLRNGELLKYGEL